jgi:hypothetical protein
VCDTCKISANIYQKDKNTDEVQRRMALSKVTKGLLISPDRINQSNKPVKFNVSKVFEQSDEFKMEIYPQIPAMLNHSVDVQEFIQKDEGKAFFESLFSINEEVLEKFKANFNDILRNIRTMNFSEPIKDIKVHMLSNFFAAFCTVLHHYAFKDVVNVQRLLINMAFTFVSNSPTEEHIVNLCISNFLLHKISLVNSLVNVS